MSLMRLLAKELNKNKKHYYLFSQKCNLTTTDDNNENKDKNKNPVKDDKNSDLVFKQDSDIENKPKPIRLPAMNEDRDVWVTLKGAIQSFSKQERCSVH